jgi:hypothetical protein
MERDPFSETLCFLAFKIPGRWTESRHPVLLSAVQHRQNAAVLLMSSLFRSFPPRRWKCQVPSNRQQRPVMLQTVMCKEAVLFNRKQLDILETFVGDWRHCWQDVRLCANWNGLVTAFVSTSLRTCAPYLPTCFSLLLACLFCGTEIPRTCS